MIRIAGRCDWQRHHPTAKRIAAAMLQAPALLNLRTRRLQVDARARFGVGECTARVAVAMARAAYRSVDSAPHGTHGA